MKCRKNYAWASLQKDTTDTKVFVLQTIIIITNNAKKFFQIK